MKRNSKILVSDKMVLLVVGIMLIIVASPWLIGLVRQQPGHIYTGLTGELWSDQVVYFSWINQAREGAWLFKNLFTAEEQQPSFFHSLWLGLGKVANLFSLSTPIIFHLARLFLAGLFLFVLYFFIGRLVVKQGTRLLMLLVIGLGAGWGWLFYVFKVYQLVFTKYAVFHILPVDVYWAEFFALRSMWHSPLTILSQLLLLLIFWCFLVNYKRFTWSSFIVVGGLILFLSFVHPYDIFTVFGVLFIFFILRFWQSKKLEWRNWLRVVGWALFVVPAVIYFLWLFTTQPAFAGWWQQNVPFNHTFFSYFLGYGWLLILPWFYLFYLGRHKNVYYTLTFAWYLWGIIIILFNSIFFARWLNGWQISVVNLISDIIRLKSKITKRWLTIITLFVFFCSFLPSVFLGWYEIVNKLDGQSPPYYQSVDFWQGIEFIKDLPKEAVILSTPETGLFIAGWSLRPTFISHFHQTAKYTQKLKETMKFFTEYNPGYFESKLKQWQVSYFVYQVKD